MEAEDMVQMEVAQKEKNWFFGFYVAIKLLDSVSRVKNNVILFAFEQNTYGISNSVAKPAVCSKKC